MADVKLDDFNGFEINIDIDRVCKSNAEELADRINAETSKQGWKGDYVNSWKVTEKKQADGNAYIVHSTNYQLAHLLENGHLIVNKKGGAGWSAPIKHIKPCVDTQINIFEEEVKNLKVNLEDK